MPSSNALKIILVISICGVLFSGYLSYLEIFVPAGCGVSPISCGPIDITISNLPACVYGLIMYTIVLITTILGLKGQKE